MSNQYININSTNNSMGLFSEVAIVFFFLFSRTTGIVFTAGIFRNCRACALSTPLFYIPTMSLYTSRSFDKVGPTSLYLVAGLLSNY